MPRGTIFWVDPDGTLYVYGDQSKPAHHFYGRNAWAWVGDENGNTAFNISLPRDERGNVIESVTRT